MLSLVLVLKNSKIQNKKNTDKFFLKDEYIQNYFLIAVLSIMGQCGDFMKANLVW
jgi:hypothetical protein